MSHQSGKLYIVSTPIGNLDDISLRAINILKSVDCILAEDTRHSKKLLNHIGSDKPLKAYHDHNEREICQVIIDQLVAGDDIALISDAGTPLINDPGYHLVTLAHENSINIIPIPGCCALIAALSASGLPTDKFSFLGFAPAKSKERKDFFLKMRERLETLVLYESTHRIMDSIRDAVEVFGSDRKACLARELTKHYEDIRLDSLGNLLAWLVQTPEKQKGEFVLAIKGANVVDIDPEQLESKRILEILLEQLPTKQASELTAKITGQKKNQLYQTALSIVGDKE